MNQRQKSGRQKEFPDDGGKVVVVAVKASLEILRSPLVWALTHVAQPGDCVKLLVVTSSQSSGKTLWGFSGKKLRNFPGRKLLNFPGVKLLDFSGKKLLDFSGKKLLALSNFTGECTSVSRSGTISDQMDDIIDLCSQMMLQLHDVYDPNKIKVKIKIVPSSGAVAAEAKRSRSNWVILDNRLKHELKCCMEELQCNIIVMRGSQPKVLRLNLVVSSNMESEVDGPLAFEVGAAAKYRKSNPDLVNTVQEPQVTPISSPDQGTPLTATEVGTSSISSSDQGASPYFLSEIHEDLRKEYVFITEKNSRFDEFNSDTNSENPSPSIRKHDCKSVRDVIYFSRSAPSSSPPFCDTNNGSHLNRSHDRKCVRDVISLPRSAPSSSPPVCDTNSENLSSLNQSHDRKSVRDVISLSRSAPSNSPPLCSICQHKAPVFGKPPRWFTYGELELATGGFSQANFLAEGGFGLVHRGVLSNGQVIAVKQHKLASSQGDVEFCSEVEVLSCAQHRNVVMLIGFCVEDGRRLLVYEYICNGSLYSHLYGQNQHPLEWRARRKIAVGAARGLRYLHEECRVGCIVHRDMRPHNILLTHDFEPLVGDFGLARWQPDGDMGVATRVIGTFGYLAPEYAQSGQITEKADVYSFGVVLVELVTGRKAMDINRPKGLQSLTEWARPLLKECVIDDLVDPRLTNCYSGQEVHNMLRCASLCIKRDPHLRPRMSQVLRMLEGDIVMNLAK